MGGGRKAAPLCRTRSVFKPFWGRANLPYYVGSTWGGAPMNVPGYRDHPTEQWDPVAPVDPGEAEDLLRCCYLETPRLGPVEARLAIVRAQIAATGTYVHTTEELS